MYRRRQAGFTLAELLLVMAIGAALVALAPPLIQRALPGVQLKGAAREVAAGLRYVRNAAVASGAEQRFRIDVEGRRFWVGPEPKPLPESIDLDLFTAQSELEGEGIGAIRFFPDGASTGGSVTLSHGERGYKVKVDWLTGLVRIAEVDVEP